MLKWLGYLCLMALLLALITSPTEKEFRSFVFAQVDTTACKPVIQYNSYKITYFKLFSLSTVNQCDGRIVAGNKETAALAEKKYLGLFGMFWKL